MKSSVLSITGITLVGVAVVVLWTIGSAHAVRAASQTGGEQCTTRLATFDTLDFDVFSNQKWPRLSESHASDIVVTWPDGHETSGIARHIEDLKGMFVYAPNTNIAVHPIRICSGDYTAVTGIMTGTFSRPMPTGDGKTVAATGKSFQLTMATIGHWKGLSAIREAALT